MPKPPAYDGTPGKRAYVQTSRLHNGRRVDLGVYGSPQSWQAYAALLEQLATRDDVPKFLDASPAKGTLREALPRYLRQRVGRNSSPRAAKRGHADAVEAFDQLLGRYASPDDLTTAALDEFLVALVAEGRTEVLAEAFVRRVRQVANFVDPAVPCGQILQTTPQAEPGSLREFFQDLFRPQRLLGCAATSLRDYRVTLRWVERFRPDLAVCDLSDAFAAGLADFLFDHHLSASTINNHLARLLALWRFAADRGLVDRLPRVKKLKAARHAPDAWNEDELTRIIAAPLAMDFPGGIGGVHAGRWFHALLLVCYWTGLRHKTLLELEWSHIDLASGVLDVPGTIMKNRRGKRFRLGADAVAAVRGIRVRDRGPIFLLTHREHWFFAQMRKIIAAAGVPPSSHHLGGMHKLRRSVATLVARHRGVAAAADLLGHSSEAVTARYIDAAKLPDRDVTGVLPVLTATRNAG